MRMLLALFGYGQGDKIMKQIDVRAKGWLESVVLLN